MHPAPSVILFTVLSGAGFGLLTFLGLGIPNVTGWSAFAFFVIAYVLAVGGLMASAFHLGNPQRALKAFTQWRTSWLSREAWLAVLALVVMGLYALGPVFLGTRFAPLGWLGSLLSVLTIFATSMIYTQLKTVPRWNMAFTPVYFLSVALAGGALLAGQSLLAAMLLSICGVVQLVTWVLGDRQFIRRGHNLNTATGLAENQRMRLFEPPHTGTNYLLREMVHEVGRKHAPALRMVAIGLMAALPSLILVLLPSSHFAAALAVLSHLAGALASRWLFFAEAEHVVGLYYGRG